MLAGRETSIGESDPSAPIIPRVALGPGAPTEIAAFIASVGIEVVPFTQRHSAALYVDFVGARPSGAELLSIDLQSRSGSSPRPGADLSTTDWQTAGCLVISSALRLRPAIITQDETMLGAVRSIVGVAASPVPIILSGEIGVGKYNLA